MGDGSRRPVVTGGAPLILGRNLRTPPKGIILIAKMLSRREKPRAEWCGGFGLWRGRDWRHIINATHSPDFIHWREGKGHIVYFMARCEVEITQFGTFSECIESDFSTAREECNLAQTRITRKSTAAYTNIILEVYALQIRELSKEAIREYI